MKYRKKPVVINAIEWTGLNHRPMFDFLTNTKNKPITTSGTTFYLDHNKVKGGLVIKTIEGECIARIGEFIVKGTQGEYYPCKADIFHEIHEKIEESKWKTKQ